MRKTIETIIAECDHCHAKFEGKDNFCPSEAFVTRFFLGYQSSFWIEYGLSLGELCADCRELAFGVIKKIFPEAKMVKRND